MRGTVSAASALVCAALGLTGLTPTEALGRVIRVDGDIQAAIDAARPGDKILVPDGVYAGGIVVATSGLTIQGGTGAVIDASGHEYGIRVGTQSIIDPGTQDAECPPIEIRGFTLRGLTVQNAEDTGVLLIGVSDFRIADGVYLDNVEYGPFPICSRRGAITGNFAAGHGDAAIYVGDSIDVRVVENTVVESVVGIEIENCRGSEIRNNMVTNNVVGVFLSLLANLPQPFNEDIVLADNAIVDNNLPNPFPPTGSPRVSLLPSGVGVLNLSADRVVMKDNAITGNDTTGLATIPTTDAPFDDRLDPNTDDNEHKGNVITGNGTNPDTVRDLGLGGFDVVFIPLLGTGSCFKDNAIGSEHPLSVPAAALPCN